MTPLDPLSLRMLDANANRAREALRVVEDYARFALNNDSLCGSLKQLRHDLTSAVADLLPQAILHRDTVGDVGTDNKVPAELHRQDLSAVVIAAGKRLGEALRVIEEVLKTQSPPSSAAAMVESVRYRFYTLEQTIARTLAAGRRRLKLGLYVLITESICRHHWLSTAQAAIAGGADCLQLREKQLDSGQFLARARQLVDLCHRHSVLCIINDRADIALLSGADGVHLGQEDLPATEARKLLGSAAIIGVSTHNIDQARQAVLDGADYIGVGPIFPSATKTRDFLPGLPYARQVAGSITIPAVAISGITLSNVDDVLATGIGNIAVTAAVVAAEDTQVAAAALKRKLG